MYRLSALVGLLSMLGLPRAALAVSYPCTTAGVTSAVAAGGLATFSCTSATTVTVTAPLTLQGAKTVLDGGGLLTISGGNKTLVMSVPSGVTATLENLTIANGYSTTSVGGVLNEGALSIANSTITGCQIGPDIEPGAISSVGDSLTITNSAIVNNGGNLAGAIALGSGSFSMSGSTVGGSSGRGIVLHGATTVDISYSTIVGNTMEGALELVSATTSLTSTLIAGNGTARGADDLQGAWTSGGHNLIQNAAGFTFTGTTTGNQIGVTPLLGPLANNGGPTQTYALLACSPGVNGSVTSGGPATDQRGAGFPRIVNGAMDIGAFESSKFTCLAPVSDVTQKEGNTGTTPFVFTVHLSGVTSVPVTVNYATSDGTATAGSDYTATSGTLTFSPGDTDKTITVLVLGDLLNEPNETFSVGLSGASGATISDATATGTITNDDAVPTLSIGNVTVTEGDTGSVPATFTVVLSAASGESVTVKYATNDGTATAGSDYTATSGTLTFAPGDTSKTITVPVLGDTLVEGDETFFVTLSAPTNATLGTPAKGTGTIRDNDKAPAGLSIGDASTPEGNTGTTSLVFTVTLSSASPAPVTVDFATSDGTAMAGSDYIATSGALTFAPGEVMKTIAVTIDSDTTFEPDETFTLTLSNASGAAIVDGTGVGTITNDDSQPSVSIAPASVVEGNSGTADLAFMVTLSNASASTVTVDYTTSDGTATAGSDYTAASGTLTFAPGDTTAMVHVSVIGDTIPEGDETLTVTLTNPQNATLGTASALGTIVDDDETPTDAGTTLDLSTAVDAGGVADASTPLDASTPADAGAVVTHKGGCSCQSAPGAVGGDALLVVLAAASAIRRRRRRATGQDR